MSTSRLGATHGCVVNKLDDGHVWLRPAKGVYKLNVDAAFDVDSRRGASGAIIRDAGGKFIAAASDFTDFAIDAASMEA